MCVFVLGEGAFSVSLTLFPMRLSVFMWTFLRWLRNKFLAWICAPLFLAFHLSTLLMAYFDEYPLWAHYQSLTYRHCYWFLLHFVCRDIMKMLYHTVFLPCQDDCHLTLRVYRTGIISMSHKECIGFTYSCACPDAELTRTLATPSVTVWPLLSLHCHASVCWWTLALLVYLTCMFLAHITLI